MSKVHRTTAADNEPAGRLSEALVSIEDDVIEDLPPDVLEALAFLPATGRFWVPTTYIKRTDGTREVLHRDYFQFSRPSVKVFTDTMEPTYTRGSRVFIRPVSGVFFPAVYLVGIRHGGGLQFARLTPQGFGRLLVEYDNPRYPSWQVEPGQDVLVPLYIVEETVRTTEEALRKYYSHAREQGAV